MMSRLYWDNDLLGHVLAQRRAVLEEIEELER